MITTTLKALRAEGACVSGYNKLVRALQGKPFTDSDQERESHILFSHADPIPLGFVLDSNGLEDALWTLRACEQTPELIRAERLFAVWCARQVQHLMTDSRSLNALDVAERHANGEASDEELDAAWDVARAAAWDARDAARAAAWAAWAAAWAARAAAWDAARAADRAARAADRAAHKDMFRKVFCGDALDIEAMSKKVEA
jgi:hypothetical protein